MRVLGGLKPQSVFCYFEDICSIPHGSGNTEKISDYIEDFAKLNNLWYKRDELGNVIIKKAASHGFESSKPVIMQAHIDMVIQKDADVKKDMSKEGLDLVCDGDKIYAKGTTLGADNGVGAAYILAVLSDNSLCHPPIEAVFTVDEEIGLLGAIGLDTACLDGKLMLNIDTECEGEFTVSCAGGVTCQCTLPLKRTDTQGKALRIDISGLSGGHSGVKINDGGANSNVLMSRLLYELIDASNIEIASIDGGFKDNAIPTATSAVIVADNIDCIDDTIKSFENNVKKEYSVTDPDLKISYNECSYIPPFDKAVTDNIMAYFASMPNGVQSMSQDIASLVQTSVNFAIINTFEDRMECTLSVRSGLKSQKDMMKDKICYLTSFLGGRTKVYGEYPGWEYKKESYLRDTMCDIYKEQSGKCANVTVIHAGLECGIFSEKISELDCISFGPDIADIHTPRETLSISSAQRVWALITEVLKSLK